MAKVQAIMSKVGSKVAGYYNHRRIMVGEIFNMHEVDAEGYYVDEKGKRLLFVDKADPKADPQPKKCAWVGKVGSLKSKKIDPKMVAAVLSGKNPGVANPLDKKEE